MCAVGAVKIVCAKVSGSSGLGILVAEYLPRLPRRSDKLELLKLHCACVVRQPPSVAMMKHQGKDECISGNRVWCNSRSVISERGDEASRALLIGTCKRTLQKGDHRKCPTGVQPLF